MGTLLRAVAGDRCSFVEVVISAALAIELIPTRTLSFGDFHCCPSLPGGNKLTQAVGGLPG